MYKNFENVKNKLARGAFPRFSAATFSVILRRYSLLEVPQRRIHNVIAKAMSICVAIGNKVMDTRLPQPAGCGDKYDVCSVGRSMIEMLGVLAIIGVLSVGGIAGYSKAMEMWKIDKIVNEFSYLLSGLMEHSEQLTKMSNQNPALTCIGQFVEAANLVPESWKHVSPCNFENSIGDGVGTYTRNGMVAVEFTLGGSSDEYYEPGKRRNESFSARKCKAMFKDLVQPLHAALGVVYFIRTGSDWLRYYGDKVCSGGRKCIKDLTPAEINTVCSSCTKNKEVCNIGMQFY